MKKGHYQLEKGSFEFKNSYFNRLKWHFEFKTNVFFWKKWLFNFKRLLSIQKMFLKISKLVLPIKYYHILSSKAALSLEKNSYGNFRGDYLRQFFNKDLLRYTITQHNLILNYSCIIFKIFSQKNVWQILKTKSNLKS
jgi:hypothetical protein